MSNLALLIHLDGRRSVARSEYDLRNQNPAALVWLRKPTDQERRRGVMRLAYHKVGEAYDATEIAKGFPKATKEGERRVTRIPISRDGPHDSLPISMIHSAELRFVANDQLRWAIVT